ncbi:hypothetical protein GY45DRAFT_1331733 [Cubamyces sp. BRFM 1775]|nr:hypothetical protein GY45DRAFT_1331733 [Cubamyces sp. BRFM 1775]
MLRLSARSSPFSDIPSRIIHGLSAVFAIVWPVKLFWSGVGLIAIKCAPPLIGHSVNPLISLYLTLDSSSVYAITLLAVLNSRKLLISRGVAIFDTSDTLFERNIITRANHLAAVERWNVPRVPDGTPTKLNIMVAAEVEVDGKSQPADDSGDIDKGYVGGDGLAHEVTLRSD